MTVQFYRKLQPISVISFDLDDTLYDNVPIMQNAEQQTQEFIARQYPQASHWDIEHWQRRRLSVMQRNLQLSSDMTLLRLTTLSEGFSEAGITAPWQAAEQVMAFFRYHRSNFMVDDHSLQLLQQLKCHYRLAAISNGNVECDKIGLADYFDLVIQPGEGLRGKPFADMFDRVKTHFEVPAERILHVGDHPYSDILGAHRAGCQSAWFRGGLGHTGQLRVLPTFCFNQLQQLATVVGKDIEPT